MPVLSRRALLRSAGLAAAGPFVAACAGRPVSGGLVEGAGGGVPARGGVLRAAFAGSGPAESLNPYAGSAPADFVRSRIVYDELFRADGRVATEGPVATVLPPPDPAAALLRRLGAHVPGTRAELTRRVL